jgi:heptosyltransferase-3
LFFLATLVSQPEVGWRLGGSTDPGGLPVKSVLGILVVRGGAIGDFVLTLPVLCALRRRFPGVRLTVMGRPGIAELARAGGLADEILSVEARGLAGFLVRDGDLDPGLASLFAEQSLIVSYLFDPEGVFRQNVGRCTSARFISGPHRPDESLNVHAADVLLAPLASLGIFGADPIPRLAISGEPTLPETVPAPVLAVHPGSGSARKIWPEERWAELLHRVTEQTAFRVLLIGGEAEGDRAARLAAALPPERVEVAQDLPLVPLARRLVRCQGFAGHDSGITHLAAALGLRCVALWGESNVAIWRPRSGRCALVADPAGLHALSLDRVFSVVRLMAYGTKG